MGEKNESEFIFSLSLQQVQHPGEGDMLNNIENEERLRYYLIAKSGQFQDQG